MEGRQLNLNSNVLNIEGEEIRRYSASPQVLSRYDG